MKFNSRICVRCGGSKIQFPAGEMSIEDNPKCKDCPNCNGEGIEYIISPKQLKELKVSLRDKRTVGI